MDGLAYSPDGKTLVSIDGSGTVNLWDSSTGKADPKRGFIGGATGTIYGITFSPDGKTLATWDDLNLTLWDMRTNMQLVRPIVDLLRIADVVFTPDGQYVAESQGGGPVILRFATPAGWATEACSIANRNLTQAEWKQFVGDEPYQKPCPDLPAGT